MFHCATVKRINAEPLENKHYSTHGIEMVGIVENVSRLRLSDELIADR